MKFVFQVIKEQFQYGQLIFRLAGYDIKSTYQMHYLGAIWQFLNPAIQVLAYWFVFGIGIRGGAPVEGVPFFMWLLVGLIPWFFISSSISKGSNSIYSKVNLASKMKFPVSVLPTITIMKNAYNFFILYMVVYLIVYVNGIHSGVYLLQLPYYLFSLFVFLFSLTLLSASISVMVRDFHTAVSSLMRMFFFLTPILWDASRLADHLLNLLKLNPFYYLVEGFRNTFFANGWFYEDLKLTIYFWSITLLILFVGAFIHVKFRNKFVDYL
jgi:teichoic acid transport system permease protein